MWGSGGERFRAVRAVSSPLARPFTVSSGAPPLGPAMRLRRIVLKRRTGWISLEGALGVQGAEPPVGRRGEAPPTRAERGAGAEGAEPRKKR
ncbi:hypothetical protein GCM10010357_10260 [Streptomyces luteireticuli]|uniref:Uncharacterized protein n=1 Tax=Streptomyces luteireticuli TaxID=173858 RepID=A0ABN0YEU7_9ACTN